jgi:hypothetical protein
MDRVLLERKTAEYSDFTLRMHPFAFRKFGIVKNAVNLKIGDYFLSCVPFDLSLKTCRAISILGPEEITFFTDYVGTTQNLNMTLQHPGFSKPISLFIKVRLESFNRNNPDSNVCIIAMQFITVPNDFKEVFVGVADELTFCRALYEDETRATASVELQQFRNMIGRPYFTLRKETDWSVTGKASEITPRRITVFADTEEMPPAEGAEVEVEYDGDDGTVSVAGAITQIQASAEVSGYAFLTVDLQYAPAYVDLIRPLIPDA